jgi:hypothetical protein
MPLSLDSEALSSSSFTAKGKFGGFDLAAGKLKISDAASFLARPELVSGQGGSLLYSGNLGSASDPLGIAASFSRLSLFLTQGELYGCGALQYVLLDIPTRVAIGVGTLLDEGDQGSLWDRIKPWLALGGGYYRPDMSFLARFHVYPDFGAGHDDPFDFSWLKAAACRLDMSWKASGQNIKGFLYAETGDFISATGKVASHDAVAQVDYEADISIIPLVKDFKLSLSGFSKQGAVEPPLSGTPSFGAYPDSFALKYWPDGGEGHFSIENKEVRACVFRAPLGLGSSFSGTLVKKPYEWSGKIGLDLNVRNTKPGGSQLGLGFALQTSCSDQDSISEDSDGTFSDISEYEESDDTAAVAQNTAGTLILDRALVALRLASGSLSCRMSVDIPLQYSDSNALRIKMSGSIKMAHFFLEASGTGDFEMTEKQFSIVSALLYVKIPL